MRNTASSSGRAVSRLTLTDRAIAVAAANSCGWRTRNSGIDVVGMRMPFCIRSSTNWMWSMMASGNRRPRLRPRVLSASSTAVVTASITGYGTEARSWRA
ncbi:hypothetical protein RCH22_002284 [Cryobacterium psychrotolerans]|nr:hypothetical protein [Cryobacterium psychrotolerans]